MTQELIDKYFNQALGNQCNELFSTADNRVFIRKSDAEFHLEKEVPELEDKEIKTWYPSD